MKKLTKGGLLVTALLLLDGRVDKHELENSLSRRN